MKQTTSIVFDHRGRVKPGQKGQLEVRVTVNRKSYYFGTGIKVYRSEFVAGQVRNTTDDKGLNERLGIIYQRVNAEVNQCIENGTAIDTEEIRRKVWQTSETMSDEPTLLDWIEQQMGIMNMAEGTLKHYRTLLTRLTEYGKIRRWKDVTTEAVYEWDAWLHGLKAQDGGKISDGAVYTYHKCLKALLNRAVEVGKLYANPYTRLRGKFKRGDKETVSYLTEEEVAAFCSLMPIPGSVMAAARDLFVFQLYTGLAYGDTQKFDIRDYKKVDGRWINVGTRIKTGVPYVSSLLPPAVEVLERYNMQLPKLDNKTYNDSLKALGAAAGITTPLHSHMARHTFATWMLRNGAKIENVSRMLGHTNIKQTERYAKVLAESVHEEYARMEALLNGTQTTNLNNIQK
jgi:integrase